jgi:hypothetical protein
MKNLSDHIDIPYIVPVQIGEIHVENQTGLIRLVNHTHMCEFLIFLTAADTFKFSNTSFTLAYPVTLFIL